MEKILLFGGGGHSKSVIDSINSRDDFEIVGIIDTKDKIGSYVNNIPIIGDDTSLQSYLDLGVKYAFVCIGTVSNSIARINIYNSLKKIGFIIPNIIDKTAIISSNALIGDGNFIAKNVIINSNAIIGNNCILNTACIIEHDCIISDFVHIAPGAVLSGGVYIGENSHLGTNATVIQYKKIGSNTMIGAGSVVVTDINDNVKAYGNPCKERSSINE